MIRWLAAKGWSCRQSRRPPCGHLLSASSPAPRRLLRSLVSLKQVIINAAHYLVLGDQETYSFDPGTPFLQMVGPLLPLLERSSGVGGYYLKSC